MVGELGKTQIVLFYTSGCSEVHKDLLENFEVIAFDPDRDTKRLGFSSKVLSLIQVIFIDLLNLKIKNKSLFENLYRKYRARIIVNYLKSINPKVVLTFIDNSTLFHSISEIYKGPYFCAIQNGGRHSWCATDAMPDNDTKYHMDEYFCFGNQTKRLFEKYNHKIKKYNVCGSVIGTSVFPSFQNDYNKDFDICYISQWSRSVAQIESLPKTWKNLEKGMIQLMRYLKTFSQTYPERKIVIVLRSNDLEEKNFYFKYYSKDANFIENNREDFTSYKAVLRSNLVLALNSTLASESFGARQKVLFVNPLNEEWLKPIAKEGIWYLKNPTSESFCQRVHELLELSHEEYIKMAKEEMEDSMAFDPNVPAIEMIKKRLQELVDIREERV